MHGANVADYLAFVEGNARHIVYIIVGSYLPPVGGSSLIRNPCGRGALWKWEGTSVWWAVLNLKLRLWYV